MIIIFSVATIERIGIITGIAGSTSVIAELLALWRVVLVGEALRRHSLAIGEGLPIELTLKVGRPELGYIGVRNHLRMGMGVAVGVVHGGRVIGVVLTVVETHHGVVVHGVHIGQVPLVLLVPATTRPPIISHQISRTLATALLPVHPLVVPKLIDSSRWRSLPIVPLLRKIPFHSQFFLIGIVFLVLLCLQG